MKHRIQVLLAVFSMVVSHFTVAAPETVTVYSYHNHPPFVTGPDSGYTFDLVRQLNREADGKVHFKVSIVPRSRLNHYLKAWISGKCPDVGCKQSWIVPWVNPKWGFIKGGRDNYLWRELFTDSNVIVSRREDRFEYTGPESLKGRALATMRGHRYVAIDDLVKTGDINRIDGNYERDNIIKLLRDRVDATLLPASTVNYYFEHDAEIQEQVSKLKVAEKHHRVYTRFVMMPETRKDLLEIVSGTDLSFPIKSQ